jgi:hypothetical protein
MIPKIIHQTWRDHNPPGPKAWTESWKLQNPSWEYRFWTDDDLLYFVQTHYPDLEELYLSYPKPVQRADMARYLILHHHGGVYADIDTDCTAPLDAIAEDTRIIFSAEPFEHEDQAHQLAMEMLVFNGVMASPKGHPFWLHVCEAMVRCRHGKAHVLESTGPLLLTGAYSTYSEKDTISISSCHLFNPLNLKQTSSPGPRFGDYAHLTLSNHYWKNTWITRSRSTRFRVLALKLHRAIYRLTRGPVLTREDLAPQINTAVLHHQISPADRNISVLIPLDQTQPDLARCFALLSQLTYPKDRLKIVFCASDSITVESAAFEELRATHQRLFRGIEVTTLGANLPPAATPRAQLSHQAKIRNHLIDRGIAEEDHWALWIDIGVCDYPPDIIERLLSEGEKVVTPDCVLERDGLSYDLSAFNDAEEIKNLAYFKRVKNGVYQPPANHPRRRPLHVFRFLDRVPLSAVGGTMLLVHAAVHKAGLRFPELPYDDLLDTEGFARMCRDFGVHPIGLPNVQIRHDPGKYDV